MPRSEAQEELRPVTRPFLYSIRSCIKISRARHRCGHFFARASGALLVFAADGGSKHGSITRLPRRATSRDQLGRRANDHAHRRGTAKAHALEDAPTAPRAAPIAQVAATERPRGRFGCDARSARRRARRGRRRGRGALRTAALPRARNRRDVPRLPGAGAAPTKGAGARDARDRGHAWLLPLREGAPRRSQRRRDAGVRETSTRVARRRAAALANENAGTERPQARGALRLVGAREARRARVRALPRLPLKDARRRDGISRAAERGVPRAASWRYDNRCLRIAGGDGSNVFCEQLTNITRSTSSLRKAAGPSRSQAAPRRPRSKPCSPTARTASVPLHKRSPATR